MKLEDLSPELQEKAKASKSPEEIIELAKEAGIELSDDELESISAGASWDCISDCHDHQPCPQDR